MAKLPSMVYGSKIQSTMQVRFGGYRHAENCGDGEFFDMANMSCEHYPVLSTRRQRKVMIEGDRELQGFYADNGVAITIAGGVIRYAQLELAKTNVNSKHTLIRFGDRCILMPDKAVLNTKYYIKGIRQAVELLPNGAALYDAYAVGNDQTLEDIRIYVFDGTNWVDNGLFKQPMEAEVSVQSLAESPTVTILDGTIYNEAAKSNTISVSGIEDFSKYFKVGDAVTISGLSVMTENNKTAVIREIDGHILRFSDYCFKMPLGDDHIPVSEYDEVGSIKFARTLPQMDGCFWHDNRLWAYCGSELFASKLGDPSNFNVFDGLSTDSWYLDTQLPGGFTAGTSFGGYPVFFRENGIARIYGSKPSAYQLNDLSAPGVKRGEEKSLAAVGGCLFYLSEDGFYMFDGSGLPSSLHDIFGRGRFRNAISGSDGRRCYIACRDDDGRYLFCYDSSVGLWMREDASDVLSFACDGALYAAIKNKNGYHDIVSLSGEDGNLRIQSQAEDEIFESFVQFGDQVDGSIGRKAVSKLILRLWVDEEASITVKIRHDHGQWITVKTMTAGDKRTEQLCVMPRRCDHYNIRIEGTGQWKLYSLAKEFYVGSAMH